MLNQHARTILMNHLADEKFQLSHAEELVNATQVALDRAQQDVLVRKQRIAYLEEALSSEG